MAEPTKFDRAILREALAFANTVLLLSDPDVQAQHEQSLADIRAGRGVTFMVEPRDRDADIDLDLELALRAISSTAVNLRTIVIDLHRHIVQARDGWAAANHELAAKVAQLTRLQRAVVEAAEAIPQHVVMLARDEDEPEEQEGSTDRPVALTFTQQEAVVLRNLVEQWGAEHISESRGDLGIISGVRAKLNAAYERIKL